MHPLKAAARDLLGPVIRDAFRHLLERDRCKEQGRCFFMCICGPAAPTNHPQTIGRS